jgi:arsenite-transporting ATPase
LNLYGYAVDMVVCNRLLPRDAGDGYFSTWCEQQARHWQLIEEGFSPLPILRVPYFEREVVGQEMLRRLGEALYGESDPSAVFHQGRPYEIRRDDGRYVLEMSLPFVDKGEVSAQRLGDELLLDVGPFRRTLVLPRALAESSIAHAHMQDSTLSIEFVGGSNVTGTN